MKNKLFILVLIIFVLLLCSCKKHTHSYADTYSGDDVYHWFECDCGEKDGYEQHAWNNGSVTKQPTVEEEGERTFTCTVCRATKVAKIDKLSPDHTHEYSIVNYDDTHHWNECECGEKGAKALHSFDEGKITTHPTTESEGERTFECTGCEYKKTEKVNKLDPDHTHSFNTNNNDEHSHWVECVCGERDNIVKHSFSDGVVTTPAGELSSGIKTYNCTVCGRMETEIIPSETENGMSFQQVVHHRISSNLEKSPRTLEAEINVPANYTGKAGAIFTNYINTRQDWLFEISDGGVPRFYYGDAEGNMKDYKFTDVCVNTGEWIHIALTVDFENKVLSLYIDGSLAQTLSIDTDLAIDTTRFKFVLGGDNSYNNGNYFRGQIRSMAVYSDVRTAAEIAKSAEKGTNLYADDLLLAYELNKNSASNDIVDLSGNKYNVPIEWLDTHEPEIDYEYSFAVIGDTQWLSKYAPAKMEGIYDWILANKDQKKIAHVFGLGDITEDWNTANKEQEWIRAYQYISKLNGIVPYSLVRGNHDESLYFNKYFATAAYMDQYDGYFMVDGDIRNSYKTLNFGEVDYLVLNLDFGAGDKILEWANDVVLAHPNHRVIITTHAYQGTDGGHFSADNVSTGADIYSLTDVDITVNFESRDYNNGVAIWEKFVSKHPNIFLVLSGHTADEDILVLQSEGDHGNTVTQMLIDPQWLDPQKKDGVGMVAMLYFSADGNQVSVEWISTDTGKYYKESNQFTLDLTDAFGASAHSFSASYDEDYHFNACACGCTYDKEAHTFDAGVTNANGDKEYTCTCGYVKVIPLKATATYVTLDGEILDTVSVAASADGLYYITAPSFSGYVAEYDSLILDPRHDSLNVTVYCSTISVWDGTSVSTSLKGSGTEADPFLIESGADLAYIAKVVNKNGAKIANFAAKHFKMTQSIDLNGHDLFIGSYPNWNERKGFYGYLDGNHCTIRGLNQAGSLFGSVECGSIKDLSVYGTISAPTGEFTGGIVAYICNGTVLENLTNYVTINGKSGIGGIVGASAGNASDIVNCVNYANITGTAYNIAGIVGYGGHDLTDCVNFGNISSGDSNVAGIAGDTDKTGIVSGCINYGSVTVTTANRGQIGGIVGNAKKLVQNCINYGKVIGVNTTGGICGLSSVRIEGCINYGAINATSWNIGGIAGRASGNGISGCVNYGSITSTSDAIGGIVGTAQSDITNCENHGAINAKANVGGIVGVGHYVISNCVNYASVNANWDCGGILGIVGNTSTVSIVDCINKGNVTATPNSSGNGGTGIGGIFGYNANGTLTITNCTNDGAAKGTWGVGGIAGNINASTVIRGCTNNGSLTANGELGGIVGKCHGKVTECTNNGVVTGANDIIGGIVGHLHVATYGETIWVTNTQNGTVTGPNAQQIIGKGYVYIEETPVEPGPLTEAEYNSQPAMFGSPWVSDTTRMKIVFKIRMSKGTTITFLGDTSIYRWGVMETTDKEDASQGAWKDTGWNTTWTNPEKRTYSTSYATGYFVITVGKLDNSKLTQAELDQIHSMFKVEGEKAAVVAGSVNKPTLNDPMVSVNHRGWYEAPENTLAAYRESYNRGFKYVECDVQFTKDGVAVLLHDDTIDRTSNGSGTLSQMTYAELLQYDFSYDSADTIHDFSAYRGEKIPTFEEFIALCKELGLHPYIEIKGNLTEEEAQKLVKIVADADMLDSVSWLGFSGDALSKIVSVDKTARLVWVLSDTYDTKLANNSIPYAEANLMTGENEVVFDIYYTNVTQSMVDLLKSKNIPLEVWTVNDANAILNLNPYVSGVSSDMYNAKQMLQNAGKLQ